MSKPSVFNSGTQIESIGEIYGIDGVRRFHLIFSVFRSDYTKTAGWSLQNLPKELAQEKKKNPFLNLRDTAALSPVIKNQPRQIDVLSRSLLQKTDNHPAETPSHTYYKMPSLERPRIALSTL